MSIEHVIDRIAQTVKREFDVHLPQYVLKMETDLYFTCFLGYAATAGSLYEQSHFLSDLVVW